MGNKGLSGLRSIAHDCCKVQDFRAEATWPLTPMIPKFKLRPPGNFAEFDTVRKFVRAVLCVCIRLV